LSDVSPESSNETKWEINLDDVKIEGDEVTDIQFTVDDISIGKHEGNCEAK